MPFRFFALASCLIACLGAQNNADHSLGYDNTQFIPGSKWRVHDVARPHPPMVTPSTKPGGPPADAIVLFDGKDWSKWVTMVKGKPEEPKWKIENGYAEVVPGSGGIQTRDKFGDIQLHLEWASPAEIKGKGQTRGNSGVILMSRYEVQVLDSNGNDTYADGQAASVYGQHPPFVNASLKPGEWQTYDIVFEAPKWRGEMLLQPAYVTVIHNGIVVHHRVEITGRTPHAKVGTYAPHGPEEALSIQNHGSPVRYRNIWVRALRGYN